MIIVSTPSVAFSLGDFAYILADGIYLKSPSGPAKIPGVPEAEAEAVKAMMDGARNYQGIGVKCGANLADSITFLRVIVPAAPGGGA